MTSMLNARDLFDVCEQALYCVRGYLVDVHNALLTRTLDGERLDPERLGTNQHSIHGFAWAATYYVAMQRLLEEARLIPENSLPPTGLGLQLVFGEYLSQIAGGIPMSAVELARPQDAALRLACNKHFGTPPVQMLLYVGNTPAVREAFHHALVEAGGLGPPATESEELRLIRGQFAAFTRDRIAPLTYGWHAEDSLIPMSLIAEMAGLGVFGLTIPEQYDGLSLGKVPMCVVTEELSYGSLAAGSLGTRSEIAAELIVHHGTEDQKRRWLPLIARGSLLPAAVFTEPNIGSDLAAVRTRAVRSDAGYRISGNKTWITHASRASLMIILARTEGGLIGDAGLSIFVAEKPSGSEVEPFPVHGLSGSEIPVIGYRGLKEFELAFDGFEVPSTGLLGGVEGAGFKQLMATFESARIQTAARAIGVARAAFDAAFAYAGQRSQFGRPIGSFQRIEGKLAWMAAEILAARALTYFAAGRKDGGRRCDVEAGMAKLLAGRVAWTNADAAVQIHGGNGYALEFPVSRLLCDARVLSIFEGAAEIQAEIIGKRLLAEYPILI